MALLQGAVPSHKRAIPKHLSAIPKHVVIETCHAIEIEMATNLLIIIDEAKDFVETKVKWNSTSRPIFKMLWCLASTFVVDLPVPNT